MLWIVLYTRNSNEWEDNKMNAGNTLKKLGIEKTFDYIYKDPDKHMPKMMDWAGPSLQMENSLHRDG